MEDGQLNGREDDLRLSILDKNSDKLINKSETLGYFKAVYDENLMQVAEGFFKGMTQTQMVL